MASPVLFSKASRDARIEVVLSLPAKPHTPYTVPRSPAIVRRRSRSSFVKLAPSSWKSLHQNMHIRAILINAVGACKLQVGIAAVVFVAMLLIESKLLPRHIRPSAWVIAREQERFARN